MDISDLNKKPAPISNPRKKRKPNPKEKRKQQFQP
jgi:hypothetical protein